MKRVMTHQYDVEFAHAHSRALDNEFAVSMVGREAPNDLVCPNQDIVRIGNLCDMAHVRRVDISFNPLTDLMGLDQLPQLRDLSAYGCKLVNLDFLDGTPRVERLVVHQNKITDLPVYLGKCTKLRELRADKNRIAAVGKFLQGCGALRVLDLR
jgi:Leucine-rich repeat (LRR) protein